MHDSSKLSRVITSFKSWLLNKLLILKVVDVDILKIFLIFSQATFNLFKAFLSCLISFSFSFLFFKKKLTNTLSKSSPPNCVSPDVPKTLKLNLFWLSISFVKAKIDTSKVPPPKSKTKIFSLKFCFLSNP